MNHDALAEFGLTRNEAKAYAALLKLGEARIMLISSRAGLHPKNAYLALDGLAKKGLTRAHREGRAMVFVPENPLVLQRLERERSARLNALIPKLLEGFGRETAGSHGIAVLRGVVGMRKRTQDLIEHGRGGTVRIINPNDSSFLAHLFYRINFRQFRRELRKTKSKVRILDRDTQDARKMARELDKGFHDVVERKYWPGLKSNQPVSWATAGRIFAIAFFDEEPLYLRVESQAVADSFNNFFDGLWKTV